VRAGCEREVSILGTLEIEDVGIVQAPNPFGKAQANCVETSRRTRPHELLATDAVVAAHRGLRQVVTGFFRVGTQTAVLFGVQARNHRDLLVDVPIQHQRELGAAAGSDRHSGAVPVALAALGARSMGDGLDERFEACRCPGTAAVLGRIRHAACTRGARNPVDVRSLGARLWGVGVTILVAGNSRQLRRIERFATRHAQADGRHEGRLRLRCGFRFGLGFGFGFGFGFRLPRLRSGEFESITVRLLNPELVAGRAVGRRVTARAQRCQNEAETQAQKTEPPYPSPASNRHAHSMR